jgi:hypothetical protein
MRYCAIILFFSFFNSLFAQNTKSDTTLWFVNNTERGGEFSVNMDKKIATILKSKEKSVCNQAIYTPPKKLTAADKCATQQKIMGYKIQIFYTKDRDAANKVKDDFANSFPGLTPELIYASPDYRILVGDYFTRQSASSDLRRIQRSYPAAFPVQWRVWCRKAN